MKAVRYDGHKCIDELIHSSTYKSHDGVTTYYDKLEQSLRNTDTVDVVLSFYNIWEFNGHLRNLYIDFNNIKFLNVYLDPEDYKSIEFLPSRYSSNHHDDDSWICRYIRDTVEEYKNNFDITLHFNVSDLNERTSMSDEYFLKNIEQLNSMNWIEYIEESKFSKNFNDNEYNIAEYIFYTLNRYNSKFNKTVWDRIVSGKFKK